MLFDNNTNKHIEQDTEAEWSVDKLESFDASRSCQDDVACSNSSILVRMNSHTEYQCVQQRHCSRVLVKCKKTCSAEGQCSVTERSSFKTICSLLEDFTITLIIIVMNCRLKTTLSSRYSTWKTFLTFSIILWLFGSLCPATASYYADKSSLSSRRAKRSVSDPHRRPTHPKCEQIKVEMCVDVGYNLTDTTLSPSNLYKQSDAAQAVGQFTLLFVSGCAVEMKLLVCSVYTPICMTDYRKFLPPCRYICERAKKGCGPLFDRYHIPWPELFQCDKFPEFSGDNQLCLHFNRSRTAADDEPVSYPRSVQKIVPDNQKPTNETPSGPSSTGQVPAISKDHNDIYAGCKCTCMPPMVSIRDPNDPLYNKVRTGGVPNCVMPCKSPYFTTEKHKFAESWVTAWSVVCFTVTLVTVSTFLIDPNRFKYPERPIIFLSTCYMFVSVGFLIRVVAGHEAVACARHSDQVLYWTTGPFLCSIVFLLVYFFGMAGALWWVILSLTWFLAAGLKWGSEAIASYSQYFHAAAWLIPALKSITVLAMSSVDGDPLSGICYVGNQDTYKLKGFVLAPLVVYLSLGGLFLFMGFVNLFRIRSSIKKASGMGGKKTDTLEKLMGRIGLFSLLYMIPSAALLACYFYEQQNRHKWAKAYNCLAPSNRAKCSYGAEFRPEFAVFIVKYSMTLLIGITNGVWICSGKTISSWREFYRRCYNCICGPTGIVSWFKRRNMKNNLNGDAADAEADIARISTDDPTSSDDERVDENNDENTSRDDSTANVSHSATTSGSSSEKHRRSGPMSKSKSSERKTSSETSTGYRACVHCLTTGCCRHSLDGSSQQCTSTSTDLNDDANTQLLGNLAPNSMQDTMVSFCHNGKKHGSIRQRCETDHCSLAFPHAYHATRSPNGRSPSRQLSNQTSLSSELEPHQCFLYCGQPTSVALLEQNSPLLMDGDVAVGRVQHIHHHHHHHLSAETCACHTRGHRRTGSQKHRHTSLDSPAAKPFLHSDAQRKFRITPPIDRASPTTYNSLRR